MSTELYSISQGLEPRYKDPAEPSTIAFFSTSMGLEQRDDEIRFPPPTYVYSHSLELLDMPPPTGYCYKFTRR